MRSLSRTSVDFSMDTSQTGIVNGYINGIATNISTRQYIDSAVQFATSTLSDLFEQEMDNAAMAAQEHFYHVYNWGDTYGDRSRVGVSKFRLWKLVTTGSGRNREVGFTFLPEYIPTPIEPELLELDSPVNEGVHVFTWKAPVMEYGIEVTIAPKLPGVKKMLFVMDGEVKATDKPVHTVPGYRTTTGMFTNFFIAWWTGPARTEFENLVKPELERDVITNKDLAAVARKATRRRRKDMEINITDFRTGEALAKKHMENNKIDYVRRARRRRKEQYGY